MLENKILHAAHTKQIKAVFNYNRPPIEQTMPSQILEFITSYSKGHAMMEVATGLIDGAKLLDLFGGARKKKSFLVPSLSISNHIIVESHGHNCTNIVSSIIHPHMFTGHNSHLSTCIINCHNSHSDNPCFNS